MQLEEEINQGTILQTDIDHETFYFTYLCVIASVATIPILLLTYLRLKEECKNKFIDKQKKAIEDYNRDNELKIIASKV